MASRSVGLNVVVTSDTKGATKGIEQATGKLDKFQGGLAKMALPATAALGALGALGAGAVSAASDMNETLNKSQVIFGSSASAIESWSSTAATSFGLSQQAALDAAAGFGDMFSQLGFTSKQAADMSTATVGLAADLGSFSNLPTGDVLDMLSGAFRGEYDSLQRVIPNINAARVEQEALTETGKKSAKQLTAQEKAHATLAIVQKDGARAAGDFAKTSDGLANSQKTLNAQWDDAQASLGQALLPYLTTFVAMLADAAKWIAENSTLVGVLVGVVAGFAAGILVLNAALTVYRSVQAAATVAQWASNAAWLAWPGTWIIAAIIAVVVVIVLLWNKNEGFRNAVIAVWSAVSSAIGSAVSAVTGWVSGLVAFIGRVPAWISGALSSVANAIAAPFKAGVALVQGGISWFSSAFGSVVGWVRSAFSGVTDAIAAPFQAAVGIVRGIIDTIKGVWNSVAGAINRASGFSVTVPDWVPVIGGQSWSLSLPNLPTLAKGGWVTSPTLALVGEGRSAEVVAPEPMLRRLLREESGGATVVNIYGGLDSADTIARRVADILRARDRRSGPVEIRRRAVGAIA